MITIAVWGNMIVMVTNRVKINELFEKLQREPLYFVTESEHTFEIKMIRKWYKFKNILLCVMIVAMIIAVDFQIAYFVVLRFRKPDSKDWRLGYGTVSIVNTTYSPNFEIVMVHQSISLFYGSTLGIVCIVIICSVLNYITMQYKILQNNLKTMLPKAKEKMIQENSDNAYKYLGEEIKNFIIYHNYVTKIAKEAVEIFGKAIFGIFCGTLGVVSVDIYRASLIPTGDISSVSIFGETLTALFATFIICMSGEIMVHESEQISRVAYEIDFVGTDLRFQKSLLFIMGQAQKSVPLKAEKLVSISLLTVTSILRASYSAYAMLKSTNDSNL
ncbi:hypothetical protein FQA39_LY16987 [Lamprigera yunnana]|nr:hypothetical protein FQA39_LY16987 [Lamprigera yunnana]